MIDSGLGGLAVTAAIRQALPNEDLIFFGDTARLPYGNKSPSIVTNCVRQIISQFRGMSPKHIVIACNTATAVAMPQLQMEFPDLSMSGVIAPCARAIAAAAGKIPEPRIGVIATEATIRSAAYEKAIFRLRHMSRVLQLPTPLLVPIIEDGRSSDDPLLRVALEQYMAPLRERYIDVLALGCTHYTLISAAIAQAAGPGVAVIDSSRTCVDDVVRRLKMAGGLREERSDTASLSVFVSDNAARFTAMATQLLGFNIPPAELMTLDPLVATPWALRQAA